MLKKSLIESLLQIVLGGGADFAEVFFEVTRDGNILFADKQIESVLDRTISGVGIRAFLGTKTVYASSSDTSERGLLRCAHSVAEAIGNTATPSTVVLRERDFQNMHAIKTLPSDIEGKYKADILKAACFSASDYDSRIVQTMGNLLTVERQILIANSEGLLASDKHVRTRIRVEAVASDGAENQSGTSSPGRGMGLELFELFSPNEVGAVAAKQALTNLSADYCKAGRMPVAIENGFGGVIFHEACGHSLEASSVGIGTSQMCGKLGQKIANEKVTAIDDGTVVNGWGSSNIDDEGNLTQRTVLIENGILKNYMIDRLGSRRMGMPMTGNSRRQDYSFEPTSRMTNTFIDNGPDKNEDIIASMEYGLYAKSMGGGSVNPLTGAFNFAVTEGYMVRNGKICEPVRGASLVGTGSEILRDIDMVGDNLTTGQGMCGSSSGSIPTDVGQPLIRVSEMTVGGR